MIYAGQFEEDLKRLMWYSKHAGASTVSDTAVEAEEAYVKLSDVLELVAESNDSIMASVWVDNMEDALKIVTVLTDAGYRIEVGKVPLGDYEVVAKART